jgi:hypothetical protein
LLSLRSPLILGAAPAGLAFAAAAWLVFHGSAAVTGPLDGLHDRLAADRPPPIRMAATPFDAVSRAIAAPLFALTTGPGAVSDVAVRLDGLAISPRGQSALLAINGKPADWQALGATRDGVTLMEVHPSKVLLDTAIGFKEVSLGQQSAASSSDVVLTSSNAIPAGTRFPPPPASAPGVR